MFHNNMKKLTINITGKSPFIDAHSFKSIKSIKNIRTMKEIEVNQKRKHNNLDMEDQQFNAMKKRIDANQKIKVIFNNFGQNNNNQQSNVYKGIKNEQLREDSLMEQLFQLLKINRKSQNKYEKRLDNKEIKQTKIQKQKQKYRPSIDAKIALNVQNNNLGLNYKQKQSQHNKLKLKNQSLCVNDNKRRSSINIVLSNTSIFNEELMKTFNRISQKSITFTIKTIDQQKQEGKSQKQIEVKQNNYFSDNIIQSDQNIQPDIILRKAKRQKCFTILQTNRSRQFQSQIHSLKVPHQSQMHTPCQFQRKYSKKTTLMSMQIQNQKLRLKQKILTQKLKNQKVLKYKMQRYTQQFTQLKRNKARQRDLLAEQLKIMKEQKDIQLTLQFQQKSFKQWKQLFQKAINQLLVIFEDSPKLQQNSIIQKIKQIKQTS